MNKLLHEARGKEILTVFKFKISETIWRFFRTSKLSINVQVNRCLNFSFDSFKLRVLHKLFQNCSKYFCILKIFEKKSSKSKRKFLKNFFVENSVTRNSNWTKTRSLYEENLVDWAKSFCKPYQIAPTQVNRPLVSNKNHVNDKINITDSSMFQLTSTMVMIQVQCRCQFIFSHFAMNGIFFPLLLLTKLKHTRFVSFRSSECVW